MAEPEILILDESLSGLDIFTENKLLNYLSDIKVKKHLSIIFISHSIESAYYIADGITVMDKGRIIEEIDDISYGLLFSIISKKKTTLRSSLHVKIILHTRKAFPFIILYLIILINPPVPRIAAVNFAKKQSHPLLK